VSAKRRKESEDARRSRYRRLEIGQVVELLRAGDYRALLEFVSRHRGLLVSHAERFGFPIDDARAVATEVLHDVAREVIEHPRALPQSMDGYVVRCFRNRVLNAVRDARRNGGRETDSYQTRTDGVPHESDMAGCSESMLRSSAGPAWEPIALAPSLERLALLLDGGLTDSERHLLSWVSEYVPQREIASWLGVTYAAARKQLERLRARLAAAAKAHAESLTGPERIELLRFFRRFDTVIDGGETASDRRVSGDA
jgi:DNA-directed RNA polymerase specialized sigma24 family protein